MDFDTPVTNLESQKVWCALCHNYLSYFPVYISARGSACGRCKDTLPLENYIHNHIYEALAQYVAFPCKYKEKGCSEKLHPTEIPDHEGACPFRTIGCPARTFKECLWEGSFPDVLHHCNTKHSEIFLTNCKFQLNLSKDLERINFIEHKLTLFLVAQLFNSVSKLMSFFICNLECDTTNNQFNYNLSFHTDKRNISVQSCTTTFGEKNATQIFLDSLQEPSKPSTLACAEITFENTRTIQSTSRKEDVNNQVLSVLKCVSCGVYLLPPIFFYEHKKRTVMLCEACHISNSSRAASNNKSQNVTVNKIANLLNYPCTNQKIGCTFIENPPGMKAHQKCCPYGQYFCPLNEFLVCQWVGLGIYMNAHIESDHAQIILGSAEISERLGAFNGKGKLISKRSLSAISASSVAPKKLKFTGNVYTMSQVESSKVLNPVKAAKASTAGVSLAAKVNQCYLIRYFNKLFRCHFVEEDERCCWTVQIIGPWSDGFMYELEILNKNNKESLIFKKNCSRITDKAYLFTNPTSYCHLEWEQISTFLREQTLTFKLRVYK